MVVFDCPLQHFADGTSWPDLLITVNFTTLGINATSIPNYLFGTVSIVVGLQSDVWDVIHNTSPIPLVPDAHLLGGVLTTIREEFKKPGLAALGLTNPVCPSIPVFYSHPHYGTRRHQANQYFTSTIPFLIPNPSLQVPRDNNTATLRLYIQDDFSDWRIFSQYREKSVLSGMAAVGGFWTVLNGIFATIFGTTLLWVFFGA
jgi:hypothetical protein